jgi:hypothetical protein
MVAPQRVLHAAGSLQRPGQLSMGGPAPLAIHRDAVRTVQPVITMAASQASRASVAENQASRTG